MRKSMLRRLAAFLSVVMVLQMISPAFAGNGAYAAEITAGAGGLRMFRHLNRRQRPLSRHPLSR